MLKPGFLGVTIEEILTIETIDVSFLRLIHRFRSVNIAINR